MPRPRESQPQLIATPRRRSERLSQLQQNATPTQRDIDEDLARRRVRSENPGPQSDRSENYGEATEQASRPRQPSFIKKENKRPPATIIDSKKAIQYEEKVIKYETDNTITTDDLDNLEQNAYVLSQLNDISKLFEERYKIFEETIQKKNPNRIPATPGRGSQPSAGLKDWLKGQVRKFEKRIRLKLLSMEEPNDFDMALTFSSEPMPTKYVYHLDELTDFWKGLVDDIGFSDAEVNWGGYIRWFRIYMRL